MLWGKFRKRRRAAVEEHRLHMVSVETIQGYTADIQIHFENCLNPPGDRALGGKIRAVILEISNMGHLC